MLKNTLIIFIMLFLFFNPINGNDTSTNNNAAPATQTPTEENTPTATPACTSDDNLDKEVLSAFSKILVHFASILQDPKNAAHRNPNLMGIAQAVCSIIMQMFRTKTVIDQEMQELYNDAVALQNALISAT